MARGVFEPPYCLRYDSRGCGLSDREPGDISFETWVSDLETVIDAAGFERFDLLGTCQGGPIAMEYARRHPERLSHLVLYGTYARGRYKRTNLPDECGSTRRRAAFRPTASHACAP